MDDPGRHRDLMTIPQVADYMQLHPESVRELVRDGRLRSTRVEIRGASRSPVRVRKRWADDYLDAKASGGPAPKPRARAARPTATSA